LTAPGRGCDHLPPDPRSCQAGGNIEMNQFPALVANEEEHVRPLEADRLHNEQVRRPDARDLVAQERSLTLTSLALRTPPPIAAYRSIADHDLQLQEFSADALMPADHRLQLHNPQVTSPPSGHRFRSQTQRIRSALRRRGFWLAAKEHLELVPQDQILERKLVAGTTAIHKDAKQHQDEAQRRGGSISR
jgi:hypothetical protein